MEDSSNCDIGCDGESVAMIPNQKTVNIDCPSSSDVKEGCESPLSSWDSEPEKDISPAVSLQDINLEGNFLDMEEKKYFVGEENIDDGFSWEIDIRSYDELLKKFIEKEEELRVSNLKLQLSEQENIKLAIQVENSKIQIDDVCEKSEMEELYGEKKLSKEEIFNLKNQIKESENQLDNMKKEKLQKPTVELNTHIPDFVNKNTNLMEQLEAAHKKLKISTDEIAILQKEIGSKSSMIPRLQCRISEEKEKMAILERELESLVRKNEDIDINHTEELRKMSWLLFDFHVNSSWEVKDLNSNIASLSRQKENLTRELGNCESVNKILEEKVKQNEAEKQKQKKLHSIQVMFLQDEISYLNNKRIDKRMNDVEASNLESEKVKIKIDETGVKNAENKLKLRVEELEKVVTKENDVILNMDEKKEEAIRKICDSLGHYRSGYTELIRALNGS